MPSLTTSTDAPGTAPAYGRMSLSMAGFAPPVVMHPVITTSVDRTGKQFAASTSMQNEPSLPRALPGRAMPGDPVRLSITAPMASAAPKDNGPHAALAESLWRNKAQANEETRDDVLAAINSGSK